ncbi:MAG: hypothetical protein ACM3QU_08920 [Verrucomicrobiota bacterium]
MTRDHVLFWLNDRCGSVVNAEVAIGRGDYRYSVLAVSGVLRHWPEGPEAKWVGDTREGVEGLYSVGDGPGSAALDLSDVPADADAWESADRDEVGVSLAEGVWLRVIVGSTTPPP